MRELIYITHPEVKIDPARPIPTWQLSDIGKQRAAALGKSPLLQGVDILLFSPEVKAVQAASIVSSGSGLERLKVENLKEFDRSATGFIEEAKYMENMQKFYETPDTSIDGWETANDAQKRIIECISEYSEDKKYNKIAIMGHGATATLYKCHIKNVALSFDEDPKAQGKYFVVDLDSKSLISDWQEY